MALWSSASYFVLLSTLFTHGAFDGRSRSVKKSHATPDDQPIKNNTTNTTIVNYTSTDTVHPLTKENSTNPSEKEKPSGSLVWLSGLSIIVVLLVILPLLWLLCPGFREKLYPCRNGAYRRERVQQEMPKTKQDVTEIQWDLPWMEMDNLLGKQQNSSR